MLAHAEGARPALYRGMTDDPWLEAMMTAAHIANVRRRGRAILRQALKDPKPYEAKPADPWLETMFHDVCDRIRAMIEARGDGEFSREEDLRYIRLVRELAEISTAMHEARARGAQP